MKENTTMQICLTEKECYFLIDKMKNILFFNSNNHIVKSILKKLCNIYSTYKHKNINFAKEYEVVWLQTEDTEDKKI